jgi:hypothetical protein
MLVKLKNANETKQDGFYLFFLDSLIQFRL